MSNYSPDVIFNAGAPIDVNKLNQLQRNIADIYKNNAIVNTTSNTVAGLEKEVRTFPIIDVGFMDFTVDGKSCITKPVTFANKNFTQTPQIVASISSNIKKDSALTIRATATSTSQAQIEVCSNNENLQNVTVNYIAIQMKAFD